MVKAKRRQYDDKFRASAVVMLEAAGYPDTPGALKRVATHLHMPQMTLSRWARATNNPPPTEIVTEKRGELLDSLKALAWKLVDAMPTKIEDANLQQSGTVLGIVMDKVLLLEGKATERVDHTGLSDTERTDRVMGILDTARARRDGRAADGGEFVQ